MSRPQNSNYLNSEPWFNIPDDTKNICGKKVVILGAGIAGVALAYEFNKRGYSPILVDKCTDIHKQSSAPPYTIFMPYIIKGECLERSFFLSAWEQFQRLVRDLESKQTPSGIEICGVLDLITEESNRRRCPSKLKPQDLETVNAKFLTAEEGTEFSHIPIQTDSILYENAGYLSPQILCRLMLEGIETITNTNVLSMVRKNEEWLLHDKKNKVILNADLIIIASGINSNQFVQTNWIPLVRKQGQITFFSENKESKELKCVLSAKGQLTPPISGMHSIGASFQDSKLQCGFNLKSQDENLKKIPQFLRPEAIPQNELKLDNWSGLRCTTADHLPIVGRVPNYQFYCQEYRDLHHGRHWKNYKPASYHKDLFILSGLGSRGFTTAPLAARIIADQIIGSINPKTREFLHLLHPARFLIRSLKRQGVVKKPSF
jgi:tRNA 5-methylaminomethyl-2-thiouridine biosynthesis bifunctional protein